MSLLHLSYIIAKRRIISAWRLELVLFLGITLAVALLSSGVVFSDLLAEAALSRALRTASAEETSLLVRVFNDLDDPNTEGRTPLYQSNLEFVARHVDSRVAEFVETDSHLLETATFFYRGDPTLELDNSIRPRGKIQYFSDLQDSNRSTLIDGSWPVTKSLGDNSITPEPIEVVIDTTGSNMLDLDVGDEILAFPASGLTDPKSVLVKISGIFDRVDPSGDFWYSRDRNFSNQGSRWDTIPLFTTEENILSEIGAVYPGLYFNVTWVFNIDRNGVRAGDVHNLQDTLQLVRQDVGLNLDHSNTAITLDRVLKRYSEQLVLARIPLFLMLFLVTGILAYYLTLVAGLTVRSRNAEIAMLKSRGATTFQIGILVFVEGLLLAIPAIIIGSVLSPVVAQSLGQFFFESQADLAPIALSTRAFLLGVAGALLAVTVLTSGTLVAARQSIVEFRQSGARPPRAPFLHRYYIDFLLLGLITVIWWQINTRGSFLVKPISTGEIEIDFTLLLGPILGLLALGLVVLRVFPIGVSLLARAAEAVGPAWLVQGLRRISRDPIMPGSLVVLLMLATALGVIGSAFSSTLDRSQRERASYEVGADLRILHNGDRDPVLSLGFSDMINGQSGAGPSAEVQRSAGQLLTQGFATTRISVLAVDTDQFQQVAWRRADFFRGQPLGNLMASLWSAPAALAHKTDGILLPVETTGLSLAVHFNQPSSRLAIQARLRDSTGRYFDVQVGELETRGWQQLQGDLTPFRPQTRRSPSTEEGPPLFPPFTLMSLQLVDRLRTNEPGTIFLDGLAAVTPAGQVILEDFQSLEDWQIIEDYTRPGLYALDLSESVHLDGHSQSAAYSWSPGGLGIRGLRPGELEDPIPAIVSPAILELANLRVGETVTLGSSNFALPITIVAVADYFPTLDPREQPFVVLDLKTFNHHANRHNQRLDGGSNELWVQLESNQEAAPSIITELEATGLRVKEHYLADDLISQRVEQPLANAGWGGLLVLMFLTLVLASASGVVLFSYMDTKERQTEFALLRTLGSSKPQLNGVVWFTLFLVVVCGIGMGTWAGQVIGSSLLPVLEVAEGGVRVTPPMVLQANWVTLTISYLVLASVSLGTVVWLAWLMSRMEIHHVLRAGEAGT